MEMRFSKHKKKRFQIIRFMLSFLVMSLIQVTASAQGKEVVESTSTVFSNPLFIALSGIVILLLIVIMLYTGVVRAAANFMIENKKDKNNSETIVKTVLLLIALGYFSVPMNAQAALPVADNSPATYYGLDGTTFYLMLFVIGIELLFIRMLQRLATDLLGQNAPLNSEVKETTAQVARKPSIIEKINASVSLEKEADIMLDHNYDGIRELDNNLPPWWKYGFYITIVWAAVYLVHFHVTRTGKLQLAEYNDQLETAKAEIEEYRKKASNMVDETNVTMLEDEASLSSGKAIYMSNCAVCHGPGGEGGVGPNLADEYWLHKGNIKDIFKTVKYGWPEKGMKSWQQDLGAKQMHEVSSYIKTLVGTNPPNPKIPQGELYIEQSESDTIHVAAHDSLQMVQK